MSIALITGSTGLIGSESVQFFHEKGFEVRGIDNNMRAYFFGKDGSTHRKKQDLLKLKNYKHFDIDIRNFEDVNSLFNEAKNDIKVIIHCAGQPSHDWALKEPLTDFAVNANGTVNLLEAFRLNSPDAVFIFTSTNKVYGDLPNHLPLVEHETRWELNPSHPFYQYGIDETMSIDNSKHSLFGVSKIAGDVMTQEYGKYFNLKTAVFRGGCLTGPAHSGAELHGFLAYLAKCGVTNRKYTIYGYKGKQVRDNIHAFDLVSAFWQVFLNPKFGEVYNIGGSRYSNCSILEAVKAVEELTKKEFHYELSDTNRIGDHIWWISDVRKFRDHYPDWSYKYSIKDIIKEIVTVLEEREPK